MTEAHINNQQPTPSLCSGEYFGSFFGQGSGLDGLLFVVFSGFVFIAEVSTSVFFKVSVKLLKNGDRKQNCWKFAEKNSPLRGENCWKNTEIVWLKIRRKLLKKLLKTPKITDFQQLFRLILAKIAENDIFQFSLWKIAENKLLKNASGRKNAEKKCEKKPGKILKIAEKHVFQQFFLLKKTLKP